MVRYMRERECLRFIYYVRTLTFILVNYPVTYFIILIRIPWPWATKSILPFL